jgi:phage-related protein
VEGKASSKIDRFRVGLLSPVRFVLHAFQKKSKKGIATPKSDIDLIKLRLKFAQQDYSMARK